jgi:quercetin dioxygenase-like cupin family protein
MKLSHLTPDHSDARGTITDIVSLVDENGSGWHHVALLACNAGSIRGNHYHRDSTVWIYILYGKFEVTVRRGGDRLFTGPVSRGDLLTIEPLECHALYAFDDSMFLMVTSNPSGKPHYESDTFPEIP